MVNTEVSSAETPLWQPHIHKVVYVIYIYIYKYVITDIHYWTYIWLFDTKRVQQLKRSHRSTSYMCRNDSASLFYFHFRQVTNWLSTEKRYHEGISGLSSVHNFHDTMSCVTFQVVMAAFSDTWLAQVCKEKDSTNKSRSVFFCILWAMFGHNIAWARCEIQFLASNI